MLYSTIVQRDETGLNQIYEGAMRFEAENALEAIISCRFTRRKVEQVLNMLRMYQARLNIESLELAEFSENFIEQYSTDNNQCFNMALKLMKKIGVIVTGSMKIFRKFCPVVRKRLEGSDNIVPVLDYTKLNQRFYHSQFFGDEPYIGTVKTLLHELATFYYHLLTTLQVCKDMIRKEEAVRGDFAQLKRIFENSCREVLKSVVDVNETFGPIMLVSKEELEERRKKARPLSEWLAKDYHNHDKKWLRREAYIYRIITGAEAGLDDEVMAQLFSHDIPKGIEVIKVFGQIDSLNLTHRNTKTKGKKGKYDSMEMVYFLKWSGVSWLDGDGTWKNEENEKKLYLHLTKNVYSGDYEFPSWPAICRSRAYCYNRIIPQEMIQNFASHLADIEKSDDTSRAMLKPLHSTSETDAV